MSVSLTDQNSTSRSHASLVYRPRRPTRHPPPQQPHSRLRNVGAAGLLLSMEVDRLITAIEVRRALVHSGRRSHRRRTRLLLHHMPNQRLIPASIRGRTIWDHHSSSNNNNSITGTLATAAIMDCPINRKGGITLHRIINSMRRRLPEALAETAITPMKEGIPAGARALLLDLD